MRKVMAHFAKIEHGLRGVQGGLNEAALEWADVVLDLSKELVPRDTGTLAASGQVVSVQGPSALLVAVYYSAPYAGYVHEDLEASHPAQGPNKKNPALRASKDSGTSGQAKFLQQPAQQLEGELSTLSSKYVLREFNKRFK